MKYKYYGCESNLKINNNDYPSLKDLHSLYDAFFNIWDRDTCAPRMREEWTKDNKTLGQCSITAFLVQEIIGGDVYGIKLNDGNYHCFNVVDEIKFDLTSEQFDKKRLDYSDISIQSRDKHFSKKEKYHRYLLLKERLKREAGGKTMIYDYVLKDRKGLDYDLSNCKGKVILIVNSATGCGFTPQYKELEKMYEDYHDLGFEIIDIPCNQFGAQAPGSDEEIHEFCQLHFNTSFPQMKKSDVNGENELPLYTYLKSQISFSGFGEGKMADFMRGFLPKMDPDYENNSNIKWNFTKFIIDRDGNVVKRFEPTISMEEVEKYIKSII